jgi:hypothetical protein
MPSILVATGFVRIDADTAPAQKTLKAFGALGASALTTAIGPAAAAASAAVGAVSASFAVATGAAAVYGAAVKAQFSQISEASQKQTTAEDAKAKATTQTAIAQKLAKENGYKYGEAVKITADMTENARRNAEDYNAALSASKSSTRAAREAQEAYKAKLAELPPETRKTAEALQNLKDSTTSWSDALSANTMPVFTRGIKFLESLLPKLTPIVKDVSREINDWVGTLGQGTAGRVFREFGENVTKNGAGALRTFLDIARNLTAGVVGLFNAFMPMSDGVTGGLEKMTARFAEWSANLGSSEGFKTFTDLAKDAGPRLAHTLGVVAEALGDVVSAAGPMAGIGLTLLEVFAGIVDSIPTPVLKLLIPTILAVNAGLKLYAIYTAAATAYQWLFTTSVTVGSGAMYASRAALFATIAGFVAHRIATLASAAATAVWTAASYAFAVAQLAVVAAIRGVTIAVRLLGVGLRFLFANPIGLAILALVALGIALWQLWKRSETFRDIVKGALNAVKTAAVAVGNWFAGPFAQFFVTAWSKIKKWVIDPIVWFFTEGIPAAARVLMQITLGWINGLVAGAKAAWGTFKRLVIDPQVKFFGETIPNAAKFMRDKVVGWWNSLKDGASAAWGAFKRVVINPVVNYFTVEIPNKARFLRDRVVGWWRSLREGAQGAYNGMRDRIFSPIGRFFKDTIPGWARTMKDKVTGFFRDMRDGIGRIWSGIKEKVKAPVNWVLDRVWNRGIYNVWDKITGWIGIKNSLGKVKMLARGGTVGNEPVGIFNRPTAIVGEGRSSYPEFVIPTDPRYRGRAQRLWEAAGYQLMADGGIIGKIGGWLSSAASTVGNVGKGALDFLSNPVSKAKDMLLGTLKGTGSLGNSPWVRMITQLPRKAIDGLIAAVKKVGSSMLSGIGLGPSAGSGVKRWTAVVQTALRHVGQSLAYTNITLRRMQQESGGNPNIVNKWDSNWKAGHPSVGLMQVIGPTFRAYAGKMRNVGPFLYGVSVNPLANVYSSMRYALSRYGSLPRAYNRPGGYRNGTTATAAGMHLFGEAGPELGFSPAGWRILNARRTAGLAGPATVIERLVLENHGVIGSRHEVENWLVESLTDLKRKGRLP